MLWTIVSIIGLVLCFIGFMLMLTPQVFFGAIVLALAVSILCVAMASPDEKK